MYMRRCDLRDGEPHQVFNKETTYTQVMNVLQDSWSLQSSTLWTPQNPEKGQCSVTALVINDIFGGEILKTRAPGGYHFYNRSHGERYDFTISQFEEEIHFEDIISSRYEAFQDTTLAQYTYLSRVVLLGLLKTEQI